MTSKLFSFGGFPVWEENGIVQGVAVDKGNMKTRLEKKTSFACNGKGSFWKT
jgi:hypothetical protein